MISRKHFRGWFGLVLLMALAPMAVAPALVARADDDDRAHEKFAAFEAEIQAAVKAGKLTEEQADKKLAALKKKLWGGDDHGENRKPKEIYREVEAKIYAAVEAGKLTEEEAEKKLAVIKKKLFGGDEGWGEKDDPKEYYLAVERKLRAAVEAGKLTEDEAEKKLVALKKKLWGNKDDDWGEKGDPKEHYLAAERKLRAAVEAGKLTEEEADEKLMALQKKLWGKDDDHHHGEEKGWHDDEREDPAHRMDRLLGERWAELEKQKAMIGEKLKKTFDMLERRGVSPEDIEKKMAAAEAEAKRALQRGFRAVEEAKEMLDNGAPPHEAMRRLKGEGRNDRNRGPGRTGPDGRRGGDQRERYLAEARRRLRDNEDMDPEEVEHHMARLREELDRSRAWGRGRPGDRRADRRGEEERRGGNDPARLPGMGFMEELEERLDEFEESGEDQFEELDERFGELDHEFEEWDERFEDLDRRFEEFDEWNERFEDFERGFGRRFEDSHERFEDLERGFGRGLERLGEAMEQQARHMEELQERFGQELERLHERFGHEIEKLHERFGHEIEKLHEHYGHEIERLQQRLESLENDGDDR